MCPCLVRFKRGGLQAGAAPISLKNPAKIEFRCLQNSDRAVIMADELTHRSALDRSMGLTTKFPLTGEIRLFPFSGDRQFSRSLTCRDSHSLFLRAGPTELPGIWISRCRPSSLPQLAVHPCASTPITTCESLRAPLLVNLTHTHHGR